MAMHCSPKPYKYIVKLSGLQVSPQDGWCDGKDFMPYESGIYGNVNGAYKPAWNWAYNSWNGIGHV